MSKDLNDVSIEEIELADQRRIVVRPSSLDDGSRIEQLARELSKDDARRRYFTASVPQESWFAHWASVGERGGYGVVALLFSTANEPETDGGEIIGEAGYALLADGDGELALSVAEPWRGWLGAYLLDLIVAHAASSGVDNLQAEVMLENRAMLALLRHRGAVARDHPDGVVRLSISTTGHVPSWPPKDDRPRVLVEVPGGRWSGEALAEQAGMQIALCSGPAHRRGACPALCGETCPLVDGADAIAVLLDPDDPRTAELLHQHHRNQPDTPIFVRTATSDAESFVHEIGTAAGDAVQAIRAAIDGQSAGRSEPAQDDR